MKVIFLLLFLLAVSCAPKDEEVSSLSGTYLLSADSGVADDEQIGVLCWLTSVVNSGDNDSVDPYQNLLPLAGQSIEIAFEGREFTMRITGDTAACISSGTYLINSRTGADTGRISFLTTNSDCGTQTSTIHDKGQPTLTISYNSLPSGVYSSENDFSISPGEGIFLQLPLDLGFNASQGNMDSNCQVAQACTCLAKLTQISN